MRMKMIVRLTLILSVAFTTIYAQSAIPPEITTPDKVETRIGTLDFKDGAPSAASMDKIYDISTSRTRSVRSTTPCAV